MNDYGRSCPGQSMACPWYAHSKNKGGRSNRLDDHLRDVARIAQALAVAGGFSENLRDEAVIAALFHDVGKATRRFQARLAGADGHLDHWSWGMSVVVDRYYSLDQAAAVALCTQGHHLGLPQADQRKLLDALDKCGAGKSPTADLELTDLQPETLSQDLAAVLGDLPQQLTSSFTWATPTVGELLAVRMLFSLLVDADFQATEAHFECAPDGSKRFRSPGPQLQPTRAWEALSTAIAKTASAAKCTDQVRSLRAELLAACTTAGRQHRPGLFTLTAPTGSGKTLAMMAFALQHAMKHPQFRRIILALPYLSIIEQNAGVLRDIFATPFGADYLIEVHSLADHDDSQRTETGDRHRSKLLAENFDAPLIVTTNAQLLESLFSNRPGRCRKLHNLANAIILMDEVQALPPCLAPATLATLAELHQRFGATVVMATATQPAFGHLDDLVRKQFSPCGWQPREIVPAPDGLFRQVRRYQVRWPQREERLTWPDLADRLLASRQSLAIVNLKRHASELFREMQSRAGTDGLYHLSTNQCPAHRRVLLETIKTRLGEGRPCRVVSTQCIEAGVDASFPVVWRALAPLDAIAQAAGRCNRHGGAPGTPLGEVNVFIPAMADQRNAMPPAREYPTAEYAQGASVTSLLLDSHGGQLDLEQDPALFGEYFRRFYHLSNVANHANQLTEAIAAWDFPDIARRYRLVSNDTISVLVPYDLPLFTELVEENLAGTRRLTRDWLRRAMPHTINLYRCSRKTAIPQAALGSLLAAPEIPSQDWFYLADRDAYDHLLGLTEFTGCFVG